MISICRRFEFHAAHHLPNHEGKCKNIHGHSYILEVGITGDIRTSGPESGMIMDFGELKEIVTKEILDKVDHKDLNEIWEVPTAEVMVQSLSGLLTSRLAQIGIILHRVRLYETSNSYAEWVRT